MVGNVRKEKMPHVFALLFLIAALVAAMTWIVPAGEFERVKENNITKVVPGTYRQISSVPQGVWDLLKSIPVGMEQAASTIFMIFFVGAAIHILEKTGTITASFSKVVRKVKGKEHYAIFIVMFIMSMGGATGIFGNPTLAMIPIGIILSRALGYDDTVGFAMIFFGAFAGFNVGWANLLTLGIAQSIAELPRFSGLRVRVLFHAVNLLLSYAFVVMYCNKIRNDPTKSLNYEEGMNPQDIFHGGVNEENSTVLKLSHIVCLVITVLGFASIIWGSLEYKWGLAEFSTVFFAMSLLYGFVSGMGINGTAKEFANGCSSMAYAAFIVGFARAISVVMADGKIIDSIVYYLSLPIASYGPIVGANLMFLSNSLINFFISSGSGQAVTVMPIMVPLADLTGITRQVAVQAFQFGDGFTNCIIPTIGSLMGGLGIAGISYARYIRWFTPFLIVQMLLAMLALTVLQILQWGPM